MMAGSLRKASTTNCLVQGKLRATWYAMVAIKCCALFRVSMVLEKKKLARRSPNSLKWSDKVFAIAVFPDPAGA